MGETADQTAAEIARLRADMSGRVGDVKRAADRAAHEALPLAIGVVGVGAAVGAVVLYIRHRHKKEARTVKARLKRLVDTLQDPAASLETLAKPAKDALRSELRAVAAAGKERTPLGERLLEIAVKAAVSAGVPIALKALWGRAGKPTGEERAEGHKRG
ncbi:MAG: hypothetical protein NVSMB32_03900 [Actinomycetota bacterium]